MLKRQILRTVHMDWKQSRRCGRSAAGMNVDGVKVKKKKYIIIIYSQAHNLEKTSKKKNRRTGSFKIYVGYVFYDLSIFRQHAKLFNKTCIIILDVTEV